MKVSEAAKKIYSVIHKKPVPNSVIKELLLKSARAASGGNLQPWKIFVLNGSSLKDFLLFQDEWDKPELPAYEIYPPQ